MANGGDFFVGWVERSETHQSSHDKSDGFRKGSTHPTGCGVDPLTYLADVITKIVNGHPNSQIDDLLPWGYSAAHALRYVA